MKDDNKLREEAEKCIDSKKDYTVIDYFYKNEIIEMMLDFHKSQTESVKSLQQQDISDSLLLLRETVMRSNLAMPENEQDEKWFNEKINPKQDDNFIERLYKVLNIGKIRVDCNDCQGQGCPTCKGYGYWYQQGNS